MVLDFALSRLEMDYQRTLAATKPRAAPPPLPIEADEEEEDHGDAEELGYAHLELLSEEETEDEGEYGTGDANSEEGGDATSREQMSVREVGEELGEVEGRRRGTSVAKRLAATICAEMGGVDAKQLAAAIHADMGGPQPGADDTTPAGSTSSWQAEDGWQADFCAASFGAQVD